MCDDSVEAILQAVPSLASESNWKKFRESGQVSCHAVTQKALCERINSIPNDCDASRWQCVLYALRIAGCDAYRKEDFRIQESAECLAQDKYDSKLCSLCFRACRYYLHRFHDENRREPSMITRKQRSSQSRINRISSRNRVVPKRNRSEDICLGVGFSRPERSSCGGMRANANAAAAMARVDALAAPNTGADATPQSVSPRTTIIQRFSPIDSSESRHGDGHLRVMPQDSNGLSSLQVSQKVGFLPLRTDKLSPRALE